MLRPKISFSVAIIEIHSASFNLRLKLLTLVLGDSQSLDGANVHAFVR